MADNANNSKLANQLSKPESQKYLEELEQLSRDPKYSSAIPPESQESLQQAINQARQAYDEKVTRNEWLDVAQNLGRAVAQFGAAQSGMRSGRDMSGIPMGQAVDFGSRSDRAFREYQQDLSNSERTQKQGLQDVLFRKEQYGRREDYLREALRGSRDKEAEESRAAREAARERELNAREAMRQRRGEAAEEIRSSRAQKIEEGRIKGAELRDVAAQEKKLYSDMSSVQAGINRIKASAEAGSSKDAERLRNEGLSLLGKGGVDATTLSNIDEQSKDSGILGTGLFRGEDKEKKARLIEEQITAPIRNMLDAVQSRKRELLGGQAERPAIQSTTSAQQTGGTSSSSNVNGPSIEQIDKYMSMYPQVSREQATDILRKRLAGGK